MEQLNRKEMAKRIQPYRRTDPSVQTPSSFQLWETDGFGETAGEEIRVHLDGAMELEGGPLQATGRDLLDRVIQAYRAKGDGFLKEVAGSFRLVLWDAHHEKLLVAVDPFATRSLYYANANGTLHIAPRISALEACPELSRELDPNVLYFYLNHCFIPAPFTVYRGIRRLEPGQYLCWQAGRLTTGTYWDLQYHEDFTLSADAAADLVCSSVEESVRNYLGARSCGANEIGAFLSGGTDSSTLVGLMTKVAGRPIKVFSVGFAEERYNEIEYARIAAARYGAQAHECFVTADQALDALPLLAAQFDEPFGNSSAIPTYFCLQLAKQAGVNVMFAGDGGDELFGGNERYLAEKYFLPFDVLPPFLQSMAGRISGVLPRVYPMGKLRRYVECAGQGNPARFFRYQTFLHQHADEFFTDEFKAAVESEFVLRVPRQHYARVAAATPLNRLLYMDLKMCIADNDLFKVNQMAGASGVNVYYPYLDKKLAELTGRIPAHLKVKGLQKRYIFKRAFANLLPEEILSKKKHGFGLPTARWLRTHAGFRQTARSLLLDGAQKAYFQQSALENLLRKHDEEKSDFYATFIWNVMMLELWHRHHGTREAQPQRATVGAAK